jgi:23S rRNA (adenine2503-C2)-methyltransferase
MKVIQKTTNSDIATVYVARSENGNMIEFVESTQPPFSVKEKWVLIVSTLFGCPINCKFCDAGGSYGGNLSYEEMMFQIDYPIKRRFSTRNINVDKFKIQFARVGEPAFNPNVLSVLESLPQLYNFKRFIPSISTIAPNGTDLFFESLLAIKNKYYQDDFQLQFSIHSTDQKYRDFLIPAKKWDFETIADYGNRFFNRGNRKITLNFALTTDSIIEPHILKKYFDPDKFLIKITPVNPTHKAKFNRIESYVDPTVHQYDILNRLEASGFRVILSIGEIEENKIGSNCGQYIHAIKNNRFPETYSYALERVD